MIRLSYPLRYPPRVTQNFGERPEVYKQYKIDGVALKGHNGLDLAAELGTEVVACDDGFAQEVIDQGSIGYGRYVKLIHSWGETVYAHQKSFNVKQGEQVKRGETIGLADSTGNSTGNHLHFGIRINPYNRKDGWGGYSDPAPYLFNPETGDTIPKWLSDFLTEKQVPLGEAEPSIREWWESNNKLQSKDTEIQSYKDFLDDLGQLTGQGGANFADILAFVTGLIDYKNGMVKVEKEYSDFTQKVASAILSQNTDHKKILSDLIKYVASSSPASLSWQELITLGLKRLFEQLKDRKEVK